MIEALWNRHYHAGVTGGFHGDMAHAFKAMLADSDCYQHLADKIRLSIRHHLAVENNAAYRGRRWFTEAFGGAA